MFAYDPEILAAVEQPPQSIPDVLANMRAIDALCIAGDGLKWFNQLYLQVTQAVEARVSAGDFGNPAWLAELDVQFATLYFNALKNSLSGQDKPGAAPTPECWQVMFDKRNQTALARIQFAFAGMNAHIDHDLAFAVVNTCKATGTQPVHGSSIYIDYTAVNSTLNTLIDTAKTELQVRLLGDALPPVSHLEDTLAAWSLSAAREAAWANAEHLWALRSFPALLDGFEDMLDGFTATIGKTLLIPVP
jgi:hypothetical protein